MIKEDVIKYRNENPIYRTLLGTVLGELDRITKNPTDEQTIQVIKKMIESLLLIDGIKEKEEAFILEKFLPKQLSEQNIIDILKDQQFLSIKECMTFFKANYLGLYDGKLVNKLFQSIE